MEFSEVKNKNFKMTSESLVSGDFKMVKVKKGKRGHQDSRSLVFRISKNPVKTVSDDSGIKCSSTEEHTSSEGEQVCAENDPLKIKIPISLLNDEIERSKDFFSSNTVSSIKSQKDNHTCESHQNEISGVKNKLSDVNKDSCENDANILQSTVINSYTDEGNLMASKDILISIPKQTTSRIQAMNTSDRRSSRRILQRVLKNSESGHSLEEKSSDPYKLPLMPSNSYVLLGEKRKRGRKPGTTVSDSKKHKYCRRGRPPKHAFPKHIGLVKSIVSGKGQKKKVVLLTPSKNSVWTLVPKELLESDFFKTHARKIQVRNPPKKIARENLSMSPPISFLSPVIQVQSSQINGNIQLQTSKVSTRNVSAAVRQTTPVPGYSKRPTVIYFNSEKQNFDSQNQHRDPTNPLVPQNIEFSKNRNNLQCFYDTSSMLEEIILKNYYDLVAGNLNEAERKLSNFLSNTSNISPLENFTDNSNALSSFSTCPIWDLNSEVLLSRNTAANDYPNAEPVCEDVDALSRNIIVQSLQVLFSEEAVLA